MKAMLGSPVGKWPVLLAVTALSEGGCERDAARIAIGLDRQYFEPHIAVFRPGGYRTREVEAAGIPIVTLPVRSFMNASAIEGARVMGRYVREHGIKLLHSFDIPLNIFAAPVARWYGVPVVITSQLSHREMSPKSHRSALVLADRLSDRIVVNSKAVGESLRRRQRLAAERLYLCYNGVDPAHFSPGSGVRPEGFREDDLVVGSVCVMRPEKRMDWLLRTFARVVTGIGKGPNGPRIRLLLVGSGPELPALKELRDSLGLGNVCHFEPGRPDVADWMRGMDIFVNSSETESFPNALLEAMACGCCVIGSSAGGIPELISHGEDGLVFDRTNEADLEEKLMSAVRDAELRERLRGNAVHTAHERFSMTVNVKRTEALYRQLLAERGVAGPVLPGPVAPG
jgi:glycosyltransferase involved in cell wall biosynthesis